MTQSLDDLIEFYDELAEMQMKKLGGNSYNYAWCREARIKAGCFLMFVSELRRIKGQEARDD